MFDPEKVERWTCEGRIACMESGQKKAVNSQREYVIASDYDQLLELYRKSQASLDAIIGIPHKTDGGDWDEIEEAQRIAIAARV